MYKRKLYEENDHKNFNVNFLERYKKRILKSSKKKHLELSI